MTINIQKIKIYGWSAPAESPHLDKNMQITKPYAILTIAFIFISLLSFRIGQLVPVERVVKPVIIKTCFEKINEDFNEEKRSCGRRRETGKCLDLTMEQHKMNMEYCKQKEQQC